MRRRAPRRKAASTRGARARGGWARASGGACQRCASPSTSHQRSHSCRGERPSFQKRSRHQQARGTSSASRGGSRCQGWRVRSSGSASMGRRGRSSPRTWASTSRASASGMSWARVGRGTGCRSPRRRRPRRWKRQRSRAGRSGSRARGWGARNTCSAPSATSSRGARASTRVASRAAVALRERPPRLAQPVCWASSRWIRAAVSWGGPNRRPVPPRSSRASPMWPSSPWGDQCWSNSPSWPWAAHQVWGAGSSTRSPGRRRRAWSMGSPGSRPSARASRLTSQRQGVLGAGPEEGQGPVPEPRVLLPGHLKRHFRNPHRQHALPPRA